MGKSDGVNPLQATVGSPTTSQLS